jgi:hypothetical protein
MTWTGWAVFGVFLAILFVVVCLLALSRGLDSPHTERVFDSRTPPGAR